MPFSVSVISEISRWNALYADSPALLSPGRFVYHKRKKSNASNIRQDNRKRFFPHIFPSSNPVRRIMSIILPEYLHISFLQPSSAVFFAESANRTLIHQLSGFQQ